MAFDVGSAVGYLMLDTSNWKKGFEDAKAGMDTFEDDTSKAMDKFSAVGSSLTSAGRALTVGVTTPLLGMGTAAVKTAAGFEASMSQVLATMGKTRDSLDENGISIYDRLAEAAQKAGETTAFSAKEAAEALNYLALAGYDVDEQIAALPKVLNLAAAGGMDLAYASDLVTDAMSALGLATDDAAETAANMDMFIDQLAKTAASSNTSVAQLGEAMLTVGGTGKNVAGGVTELNTALGILADNGIKASEGGTALRNIILAMTPTTEDAVLAFEHLGVKTYDANGNLRSLNEIFSELNSKLSSLSQEEKTSFLNDIFNKVDLKSATALLAAAEGGIDNIGLAIDNAGISWDKYEEKAWYATNGIQGLIDDVIYNVKEIGTTAEGLQDYLHFEYDLDMKDAMAIASLAGNRFNELSEAIENSGGAAQTMADTQLDNLEGQMTILKSGIEAVSIGFGNLLLPVIKNVVDGLQKFIDYLNSLDEEQRNTIITILAVAAALGPLLIILGKLFGAIGAVIGVISGAGGLSVVLAALTGPIGIIIAAIAAFALAWATNFEGVRDKTEEVLGSIQSIVDSVLGFIKSIWDANLFGIREIVTGVLETISQLFSDAFDIIVDIFHIFADIFNGDWDKLWEDVQSLVKDVLEAILRLLGGILDLIIESIVGFGKTIYTTSKNAFMNIYKGFKEKWDDIKAWFKKAKEDPVEAIKSIGTSLYNAGKDVIKNVLDGFKKGWEDLVGWVTGAVDWIKDKFDIFNNEGKTANSSSVTVYRGPNASMGGSYASGLDYVPRDMGVLVHEGEAILTKQENQNRSSGGGDTYNFYSPEALTPVKAAREFKRVKQELALGYR